MIAERILALDIGTVRIGVAMSDPMRILASPLATIPHDKNAVIVLRKIIGEYEIRRLLVGYPLNLKGEAGKAVGMVENFLRKLEFPGETIRWDERYTTVSAVDLLRQSGKKPSKNKGLIDRSAAAVMLQEYLDSKDL